MRIPGPMLAAALLPIILVPLMLRLAAGKAVPPGNAGGTVARQADYSRSGYDIRPLDAATIDRLAKNLTPEQRRILLDKDTERPFCGLLVDNKEAGTYVCRLCGLPLFSSDAKFHSGTGWPSFFRPFDPAHVREVTDTSHGMTRTEVLCSRCGSHLGHVFHDGPRPTGLRYCMNSDALKFYPKGTPLPPQSRPVQAQTAYFAGGCFWGVEDSFSQVPGVIDATSGYMGGRTPDPTYEQVSSHATGHAETVRVTYDPARLSYHDLLVWFFTFHDPTQVNRQGPDVGDNYRSAVFAANDEQLKEAKAFLAEQQKAGRYKDRKIATQVVAGATFYEAEAYHQDYHAKHGGACPLPQ